MGNEENRFEKRQDKKNINKKSLVKRIILGALAFILIFFISIFGYFYFKYGSFLGEVFNIVKDVKQDVIKVEEPINVLLLGMDIGDTSDVSNKDAKRTDTIILANFDPITKEAKLISIPRDTRVKIGGKSQKINAAYPIGGEKLVKQLVGNILGVKVDYVVKVDYEGFRGIIDAIGGIDMYIEQDMNYDDPGQDLHIHFNKGETVHLDGKKAEEFFRWRKNNDGTGLANGDVDRIKNQQKFINAVIDKVLSVSTITKIDSIAEILNKNIETNIPLNCTKINGLAANVQKQLNENGYDKVDVGNGDPREKSEILIKDESSRAFMENDLKIDNIKKGISSKYDGNGNYDVVILLGKDFKNFGEMK